MAIKGQGAILSVASAASGSALAITGITNANPAVATCTNTFAAGDVVFITGVVGMTDVDNQAFIVASPSGSAFALKGVDSTNFGVYASGGTAQKYTMQALSQPTQISGFDGQASEIDVTHLQSVAKEILLGLQDFGNVTLKLWLLSADTGQALLRSLKRTATFTPYSLKLSDGSVSAFMAGVKQFSFDGVQPDGAVGVSVTLRVTNQPAWFA